MLALNKQALNSWHIIVLCLIIFQLPYYNATAKSILRPSTQLILGKFHFKKYASTESTIATTTTTTELPETSTLTRDISIGACNWVINRKCPDADIKFYLYTRLNPMDRQNLQVHETLEQSNLTDSNFNAEHPTKIIIHGYNSDMFLSPLYQMREEYLAKQDYNIIYVDWSILSPGPCYISAVHNTRHTGACVAQLVERILDLGSTDIHVIGFSLGAQVTNFIANNLGSFLLPRITGLDPAMPLFVTSAPSEKLDPSDAAFVDVIHTNALVQGKLERCGHADFYMNGGIFQPGCSAEGTNMFSCSHQRAPRYFLESIRSPKGFWGWACSSYLAYLLGMCPPTNYLLEAGENIRLGTHGMFLIETNHTTPFAMGKWTELPTLGDNVTPYNAKRTVTLPTTAKFHDPLLSRLDPWAKLEGNYNDLPSTASMSPYDDNWSYFAHNLPGTTDFVNEIKEDSVEENMDLSQRQHINRQFNKRKRLNSRNSKDERFNWEAYKRNLSMGFVDYSIFKLPHLT